jgi:hypothetical protein
VTEEVRDEPEWLRNWRTAPRVADPTRDDLGRMVPGVSLNPAGRPPGIVDKRQRMAQAYAGEFDAVALAIIKKAKAGDTGAAALYLSRMEPPLRPRGEPVRFTLDARLPLAQQAEQVLQAAAEGQLTPEEAEMLLRCVNALGAIRQTDELEKRIKALEGRANAAAPRGGVIEMEDQ